MNDDNQYSDSAVDIVNAGPSLAAAARRRRMHLRTSRRRIVRASITASLVFAAAMMITPKQKAGSLTPGKTDQVSSLTILPAWRPAGAVLTRTASGALALPFSLDPRISARRESLARIHKVFTFSSQYKIAAELAGKIYDAAIVAGIEPELAFRLVRVESVFDPKALSPVGAVGLTQLMLGTAREFEADVTKEDLMIPEVNLRIGLRYLRALIREYKGDLRLALLTYNRGPVAVQNALSMGLDPANGYELVVMRGYRGRGTLD